MVKVDAVKVALFVPPQPVMSISAVANKVEIPNLILLLISLEPFTNGMDFRRLQQKAVGTLSLLGSRKARLERFPDGGLNADPRGSFAIGQLVLSYCTVTCIVVVALMVPLVAVTATV
jgi:hypothetical protein